MKRTHRLALSLLALAFLVLGNTDAARAEALHVIRVAGTINPASSDFIQRTIEEAEAASAVGVLLELDTPGGLVSSTKDIIQAMLNARIPVLVYVSPQGAWAGSAGTFITIAAHVAAMAPGTSIGAAHPVGIGGGAPGGGQKKSDGEGAPARDIAGEKAENLLAAFIESIAKERGRNVEWAERAVRESVAVAADEALELGVIDIVASSRADLLEQVEGKVVKVAGVERPLHLRGVPIQEVEMRLFQRIMHVIASPDVAVLLLMAGLLGLYLEFQNPGTFVPGILGAASLVLAMIAMQILPFSWLGLIVFFAGIALTIAELFLPAYGLLFVMGLLSMLFGGTMIFDMPEVSDLRVSFWSVLLPTVLSFSAFGALVAVAIGRSRGLAQVAGTDELVGMEGEVESPIEVGHPGRVFLRGEYWNASTDRPGEVLAAGDRAEVVRVEGLRLWVRRRNKE